MKVDLDAAIFDRGRRAGLEEAAEVCTKLRETASNQTNLEAAVVSLCIAAIKALLEKSGGVGGG